MSRRRFDEPMYLSVNRRGQGYWRPISCDRYFWSNVVEDGECWRWTGYKAPTGYGVIGRQKEPGSRHYIRITAHRYAYEDLIGEVPVELDLDRLCRNRWCVNPFHLDPVPPAVNNQRGIDARRAA